MLEDGYAAVTYRRVAAKAGVTAGLVQYYFPSIDDLFVALLELRLEQNLRVLAEFLEAHPGNPLRAIWEYCTDETTAAMFAEVMALGNHRKAIRTEIAAVTERLHRAEREALAKVPRTYRFEGSVVSIDALLVLLTGLPKLLLMDADLGVVKGRADVIDLVEGYLERIEVNPSRSGQKATRRTSSVKRATSTRST